MLWRCGNACAGWKNMMRWAQPSHRTETAPKTQGADNLLRGGRKKKRGLVQRHPPPCPSGGRLLSQNPRPASASVAWSALGWWGKPAQWLPLRARRCALYTPALGHPTGGGGDGKEGVQDGSDSQPAPTSQEAAHYPASLKSN